MQKEQRDARTRELSEENSRLQRENAELTELLGRVNEIQSHLVQVEKMAAVGQLAAGLAHEINNPLGFVISNLGSLGRYVLQLQALADLGAATPAGKRLASEISYDFLREDLQDILTESRDGLGRVRKIVADLKSFSHVDEAEWQDTDLLAALERTLNVAGHELGEKARIVRALVPLPLVRCMPAQINQVLLNVLLNAAQALTGPGTITLSSGISGAQVWIEIADTGCGMDEATRRRVFEPFFTNKPLGTGIGLGLSVSWDIVQKHGGSIEVTSAPGAGAVFRIWLPVAGPGTGMPAG